MRCRATCLCEGIWIRESSGRHTGGSDIPEAGWHGFDPTNNKHAGNEHVYVAVTREQDKAAPISGPVGAFNRMEVSVQIAEL